MENDYQRKIGALLRYIHTILSGVITVFYIPILLNSIGDNEYGLYQLVGSFIAYFSTIYTSLSGSVTKHYTEYLIKNDTYNMINVLGMSRWIFRTISGIIIIISIPISIIMKIGYKDSLTISELNESMIIFAIMIANLLICLNNCVYSATVISYEKFIFRSSLDIVLQILQPIIVVIFISHSPYALTIVIVQICLNIVNTLVTRWYAIRKLNVTVKYLGKDILLFKRILNLTGSVFFVVLADQIFWKTDQLILGSLYGTEAVAIYSIGSQLNTIYISVGIVIGSMILPLITRVINNQSDSNALSMIFTRLGRIQSYVLCLFLSGVVLFGKEFIRILTGDINKYSDAYVIALLLMIPYTIDLIQNSGNTILQAKNEYWKRAKALFISALINNVLTVVLSKAIGITGAAIATTISIIATSWIIMNAIYMKVGLDIKYFWLNIFPIWGKCFVPLCIGFFIKMIAINNIYIQFAVHVFSFIIVYMSFCYFFVVDNDEKQFVVRIRRNRGY